MWDFLLNMGKNYLKDYATNSMAGKTFDMFSNMGKEDKDKTKGNMFNMFQGLFK